MGRAGDTYTRGPNIRLPLSRRAKLQIAGRNRSSRYSRPDLHHGGKSRLVRSIVGLVIVYHSIVYSCWHRVESNYTMMPRD